MTAPAPSLARDRAAKIALLALVVLGTAVAWRLRFVQDDAFISFLYARNWTEGHGLTWFGNRVEGYTNFLWVAWMALGFRLGAEPILWSQIAGLTAFASTLWTTALLGRRLLAAWAPAILAVVLCLAVYSFLCFATGGLETMLQTGLATGAALVAIRMRAEHPTPAALIGWGTLAAAALLTRLDSAVLLLPFGLHVLGTLRARRAGARSFGLLAAPLVLLVGGWMAWKLAYYGDLLPNTYLSKVDLSTATFANGLRYLKRYWAATSLWVLFPVVAARMLWLRWRCGLPVYSGLAWLAVVVLLWWAYLLGVGGDFMEFRMMVPVTPFVAVLLATVAAEGGRGGRIVASVFVFGVLGASSIHHARTFRSVSEDRTLDSVRVLGNFYELYPNGHWDRIGRALRQALEGTDASIALHAVGAIPFYSRLRTLDMYGLNDRDIARSGLPAGSDYPRPGHRRQVRLTTMRRRGVNFVIGHPTIVRKGVLNDPRALAFEQQWVRDTIGFSREHIGDVTLVALPLDAGALLMWYLTASPEIDARIREQGWEKTRLYVAR